MSFDFVQLASIAQPAPILPMESKRLSRLARAIVEQATERAFRVEIGPQEASGLAQAFRSIGCTAELVTDRPGELAVTLPSS